MVLFLLLLIDSKLIKATLTLIIQVNSGNRKVQILIYKKRVCVENMFRKNMAATIDKVSIIL